MAQLLLLLFLVKPDEAFDIFDKDPIMIKEQTVRASSTLKKER